MCAARASVRAAKWAVICALVAGGANAQSGFGGSFDESFTPPVTQPETQAPPAVADDGFGGSFGSGAQPDTTPPTGTDGGGFSGGSFDTDFVPPRPGEVPQQQPEQQQAQPEVPPPPPVDDSIAQFEGRDYGVPPTSQLRSGQMHAPTPTSLPGGFIVSTAGLVEAMNQGIDMVLIDVLGSDYSLPDAMMAPALATPGHMNDRLQQQAKTWLSQITQGNTDIPIVVYCSDPHCWLSYNAGLRVVSAGFTNVYWYRGGLQAWQMAGLQLVPAGF